MDQLWIGSATTASGDDYMFVFNGEPTRDRVILEVMQSEGEDDFDWYSNSTSVEIKRTDVIELG